MHHHEDATRLIHNRYSKRTCHKNAVSFLWPEISGVYKGKRAFIGTISELLSDVYSELNVGLWLCSPSSLYSPSSPSVSVARRSSPPWGREIVDSIEFSTVLSWRCRIISSAFSPRLAMKNYRIIDTVRAFASICESRDSVSRDVSRHDWFICIRWTAHWMEVEWVSSRFDNARIGDERVHARWWSMFLDSKGRGSEGRILSVSLARARAREIDDECTFARCIVNDTRVSWYFGKYDFAFKLACPKGDNGEWLLVARMLEIFATRRAMQTDVLTDIFLAGQSVRLARRTTLRTPRQASANLGKWVNIYIVTLHCRSTASGEGGNVAFVKKCARMLAFRIPRRASVLRYMCGIGQVTSRISQKNNFHAPRRVRPRHRVFRSAFARPSCPSW